MKNKITFLSISLTLFVITASAFEFKKLSVHNTKKHMLKLPEPIANSSIDEDGIKGKLIVTAGIGFNFSYLNFTRAYLSTNYFDGYDVTEHGYGVKSIPMINAMVDYGLGKNVSFGFSVGYQTTKVTWGYEDGYYNQITGGYTYHYETITDNWTRIHVAARGDYRIIAKKNIGMYTGLKIGYNQYRFVSSNFTAYDPNYLEAIDLHFSPVSVQAHFGFSYWFAGIVGINTEIGIGVGGPYIAALGATVKI